MDAPQLLGSLRRLRGEELSRFLDREIGKLPVKPRAMQVLREIILLAHDLETWSGSRQELAARLGGRTKYETVKRGIADLQQLYLLRVDGDPGRACTYQVRWGPLLAMQRRPLFEEPAPAAPTAFGAHTDPGQTADPGHKSDLGHADPGQPHLTQVTDLGQQRKPRKTPCLRRTDLGHPDLGQRAASADADGDAEHLPSQPHQTKPASPTAKAQGAPERARDADGDAGFKRSGGKACGPLWNRRVDPAELKDPAQLHDLFSHVVAAGLATDSEQDLIEFVALVTHINQRRGLTNPLGLLTSLLQGTCKDRYQGRDWRQRATAADVDAARAIVRRLNREADGVADDPPARDAYRDQLQAANDLERERQRQIKRLRAMV